MLSFIPAFDGHVMPNSLDKVSCTIGLKNFARMDSMLYVVDDIWDMELGQFISWYEAQEKFGMQE